ncbi:MAG: GyrI-like domain-containing protein [Planctomycetes bacterium]|nr:GyrI-like domain-containing protein [Planctomycetota bacterium]
MADKLDLKRQFKHLYSPSAKTPAIVEVPAMNFLMVDGMGDPNTSESFRQAIEALYSLSYTIKFHIKLSGGQDFVVMPLEGLWWSDDPACAAPASFIAAKDKLKWTMMIAQPEPVTAELVQTGRREVSKKKDLPTLDQLRWEQFDEGLAAQVMHIGPYTDEVPTIERLQAFITSEGYRPHGKHHEIYLSDPNRTAPERLKTIIRYPVERASSA